MESKVSHNGNSAKNRNENMALALNNIDLKLLRVFKCVVESGGLTAASHELNTGLAAISKQISDLEIRLGMTLCSRGREGFELTPYGITVYQATLELFLSLSIFREKLHNSRNELLGEINICVVDNTISDPHSPVVRAIRDLHQRAPKIQIRLQTSQLDDIERAITEGRVHCGIGPVYEEKEDFDYIKIYQERSKLYCSHEHPLYQGAYNPQVTVEELKEQKIVNHMYAASSSMGEKIQSHEKNVQAIQVESVAMLIMTGCFIGYLPEHYAADLINKGKLCALGDESTTREIPFCLMMKKGRKINQIIQLFIKAISGTTSATAL